MADSGLLTSIDPASWAVQWNVNCQPVGDAEASLKYLAPYVFRVAIADSRIVAISGRMVTFTYRKSGSNRLRTMTVEVMEFIRRFLLHALPPGFMKVRHYGFLSSGCKIPLLTASRCSGCPGAAGGRSGRPHAPANRAGTSAIIMQTLRRQA